MSQPSKIFQKNNQLNRMGSYTLLHQQVQYWQKITKLIQPLLPQPEQWQVVCFQSGILTVTGTNQAMVNQLNYLRTQYTATLSELEPLKGLTKIQATLTTHRNHTPLAQTKRPIRKLNAETKEMFASVADSIEHPALKRAFEKLANSQTE